jgi:hypothetical protein
VTFDSSYDPTTGTEYWGTWHADPNDTQAQNDPHDIAVVVLNQAVTGITPPEQATRPGGRHQGTGWPSR